MSKVIDLKDPQRKFAIESGIPIAPGKAANLIYPFGGMEVGESFAIGISYREVAAVKAAVYQWNKKHPPMKFVVRRVGAAHRCWRIA